MRGIVLLQILLLALLLSTSMAVAAREIACEIPLRDTGWCLPKGTRWYVELIASREITGACCPAAIKLVDSSGNNLYLGVDCHAGIGCTGLHLVLKYNGVFYSVDKDGNIVTSNDELWLEDYGCGQFGLKKIVQVYFDYDCNGVLHLIVFGDRTFRFDFKFDGSCLDISTVDGSAGYIVKCESSVKSGEANVYKRCAPSEDYSNLPKSEFNNWDWKKDVRLLLYAIAATFILFGIAAIARAIGARA